MAPMISFILLLSLSISVRAIDYGDGPPPPARLVKACAKTPEPEVCVDELTMFKEIGTKPLYSMTIYSISAASLSAQWALEAVTSSKKESSILEYRQCLKDCSHAMKDAIRRLDKASDLWYAKKYVDFDASINKVMTEASTCDNSCKGNDGRTMIETLPYWTDKTRKLCKIILAFAESDKQN